MNYLMKLLPMLAVLVIITSCATKKEMITFHGIDNKDADCQKDAKAVVDADAAAGTAAIAVVDAVADAKPAAGNAAIAAIINDLKKLQTNTTKTIEIKEKERLALIKKLELTKAFNRQIQGDIDDVKEKNAPYEFLKPKMAVNIRYFKDTGSDDTGEIDVFSDGRSLIALSAVIDLIRVKKLKIPFTDDVYLPMEFGVNVGLGVGAANIVDDAENKTAAALLGTAGIFLDFFRNNKATYIGGLELGYAYGYTFEESFSPGNNDDSAWYIGYTYKFTF